MKTRLRPRLEHRRGLRRPPPNLPQEPVAPAEPTRELGYSDKRLVTSTVFSEWLAGRRVAPFYVTEPEPYRPHLVVWIDPATGQVPGLEAIQPEATAGEAADALVRALRAGPPRGPKLPSPRSVRVEDPVLAAALQAGIGPELEVKVGPTPELNQVLSALAEHIGGGPLEERSYLEGGRVSAATVSRFFQAAARVEAIAPWTTVEDSQVLKLDALEFGVEGACVSIIGALGQSLGFIVFESIADFKQMARSGDSDGATAANPGIPIFSVNFDRGKNLPPTMRREISRHGWRVATGHGVYPWILCTDADGVARPLTERDYLFATACLEALAAFFERHRDLFEDAPERPVAETAVLDHPPGHPSVRLTAPHPDADWQWGEETPLDPERRDAAGEILDAFVLHGRLQGKREGWLRGAEGALLDMLSFKIDVMGEPPLGWTAELVETYLLEYVPEAVLVADDEIEAIPEYLDAFFSWLGDSGREEQAVARSICERIARRRQRFIREARDPARSSPAKTLVAEMLRQGVDLTDQRAVTAFIEALDTRLATEPGLLPHQMNLLDTSRDERQGAAPESATTPRPRWAWMPGSPVSDPAGPCPCGSGRRYRKCCMPR